MKNILYPALAAVVLFASCAKNVEPAHVPEASEVKVEFTIAERSASLLDTKAVKSEWEPFDMITVALSTDESGNDYPINVGTGKASYMTFLRMNDGTWKVSTKSFGSTQDYNGCGIYKALYYSGSTTPGTADGFGVKLPNYKGGEYLVATGNYEILGDVVVLGTITMQRPEKLMQVTVKELALVEGDWTMTLDGYNDSYPVTGVTHMKTGSIELESQFNVVLNPNSNNGAMGVAHGEDMVFCFSIGDNSNFLEIESSSTSVKRVVRFLLSNGTDTYMYSKITPEGLDRGVSYLLQSLDAMKENSTDRYWVEQ